MATWQYTIELIPCAKLVSLCGRVPQDLREDSYESVEWWSDHQPPSNYEALVASFISMCPSWSTDVKCWGAEDSNVIKAVLDDQRVIEVVVRVDLRKLDDKFLQHVVDFAVHCRCVLLTEDMKLVEPDVNKLKLKLMDSNAARFVEDPAGYFEELERNRQTLHTVQ